MTPPTQFRLNLVRSLRSRLCPACARAKRKEQTLCPADYGKLPPAMRKALYNQVGAGYEEAFTAAMAFLGVTDPRWPL